jgi:hypothetical protein
MMQEKEQLSLAFVKTIKCECCNQGFDTQKQLAKHLKSQQKTSGDNIGDLDVQKTCLFCSFVAEDLQSNLKHMMVTHGFFIPDMEHVKSFEGLLTYLHRKVRELLICLYCNSGYSFRSVSAVQQHMRDKQHCFLSSDDPKELEDYFTSENERSFEIISSEDDIRLDHYVDLGSQSSETCSFSLLSSHHPTVNGEVSTLGELRLPSGKILGTKDFWRYYKQYFRPVPKRIQEFVAIASEQQAGRKDSSPRLEGLRNDEGLEEARLRQGLKNNMLQPHFRRQIN